MEGERECRWRLVKKRGEGVQMETVKWKGRGSEDGDWWMEREREWRWRLEEERVEVIEMESGG
jgi:hypothetical protein